MNLKQEFNNALLETKNQIYPYILINRTNQARTSQIQVFIDIFSRYRKVVMSTGLFYLISARDFNSNCLQIDSETATKKVQKTEIEPSPAEDDKNPVSKHESKRDFERRVKQIIRRYRKRTFL